MSDKMLDLTDVKTEDFEAIKTAIENWKLDGMDGKFGYITEAEAQEYMAVLKHAFVRVYKRGVLHGGLALIGGVVIGTAIRCAVDHCKAKKEEDK